MMPSIPQLLIVLVIVVLLFGAKRLRTLGGDLGGAVKGFKKAMGDEDEKAAQLEDGAEDAVDNMGEAVESTVTRESDESKV